MKTEHHDSSGRIDPLAWIEQAGARTDVLLAMHRQRRRRRRRELAAAAGACVAVLIAGLVFRSPELGSTRPAGGAAVVHVPERRTLPDGSVVELKNGAALHVAFTAESRRVELERGEAHFQVVKDPARPFVVTVGEVAVRAVGTAFAVERGTRRVEVLVTEGRVAIDRPATLAPDPGARGQTLATVDAGNRVSVDLAASTLPPVAAVSATEMKQRLAWRVPRLEFSGMPLSEVLPMINAHSPVKLVLADERLGTVAISGVLRADNIDTLRELLAEAYQIQSHERGETEIVLSRR